MRLIPALGEQLLDRYVLEELVSSNEKTAVFRSTDTRLEVNGAVKLLLTEEGEPDHADRVKRFLDAARSEAKLNHPNIVHVTNIESKQGVTFSVREWLCGMTLANHFSLLHESLNVKEIVGLFISVADAVGVAHSNGVLHRILNPTNIFLNQLGTRLAPCILNFGTNRTDRDFDSQLQLPYLAPEQFPDFMAATEQSDIFSLCATMFFAFRKFPPVQFNEYQQYVDYYRSVSEIPIPTDIPADFVPLLKRGLSINPEQRFPNMMELLKTLREVGSAYSLSANLTMEAPKSYTSGSFRPIAAPTNGAKRSVVVDTPAQGGISTPSMPEFRKTNSNPLIIAPPAIPQALEQYYRLVQPISHTDEKSVLLVQKTDDNSGTNYVLKLLHHPSPAQASAFQKSIENTGIVACITPNIQNILVAHEDCCAFLTTANERQSLTSLIAQTGPINEQYTLQVAILLAQSLVCMHEAGIVHGNIKPNNVFFENRNGVSTPLLFDLGQDLYIERPQDFTLDQLPFIAPETGFNLRYTNVQSDIFAFGMLLNTMLLGSTVYASTRRAQLYREITSQPQAPSLSKLAPNIHPDFVRIIDWCTSFDPNGRYRKFNDVLRDLYIVHPTVAGQQT